MSDAVDVLAAAGEEACMHVLLALVDRHPGEALALLDEWRQQQPGPDAAWAVSP